MKLVLHIGLPKSGTTSIQHALELNKSELFKNKINYISYKQKPPMAEVARITRYSLEYYDRQTAGRKTFLTTQWRRQELIGNKTNIFTQPLADSNIVLISSENLCFYSLDDISRFIKIFEPDEVETYISVRNASDILESLYWQSSKVDTPTSLNTLIKIIVSQSQLSASPFTWFNIANIIPLWERFGDVRLVSLQTNCCNSDALCFNSVDELCKYMTSTQINFSKSGSIVHSNKKPAIELPIALNYFKAMNGIAYDRDLVSVANNLRAKYPSKHHYISNELRGLLDSFFAIGISKNNNMQENLPGILSKIDLNTLCYDENLVAECVKSIRKRYLLERFKNITSITRFSNLIL